jgi:hypothetical protein
LKIAFIAGWLAGEGFEEYSATVGWLAASGKLRCQKLARTREQFSSNLELVTAPFSRFFIRTTPNYR